MMQIVSKSAVRLLLLVAASMVVACEKPTPEQIQAKLHLPEKKIARNIGLGKSIYQGKCVSCHGSDARGTNKGPPLVHSTYRQIHHPDLTFHLAVKNGAKQHHWYFGHMPPIEGLTPEHVEHVIGYVRAEQRRAGIR